MKPLLVILTPGFPKDESDTACIAPQQVFVRSLTENFSQYDISILSFQYPYHQEPYNWYGIPVIPFGGRNRGGLYRWLLRKRIHQQLEKINSTQKIAGILSFWYGECALAGDRFSKQYNIPHYSWILGQDAGKTNRYVQLVRPNASWLIALSDFIADEFEKNHGIRPAHIIPPGIDPFQFPVTIANKNIDILGAGSLIPLKQFDIFIEVIAALKKEFPLIRAMLAGKGPESRKLRKKIIKEELESNIMLAGELPHTELLELMAQSKVFLHTSRYEGFGVVCIEAVHAGAHVVSFCQPMKQQIDGWHIAETKEQMTDISTALLKNQRPRGSTPFPIKDSAREMMRLFGYSEDIRC